MHTLYLHAGMPKCGSSSVQTVLSSQEFLNLYTQELRYIAIQKNGVLSGKDLVAKAASSPYGYASSLGVKPLGSFGAQNFQEVKSRLAKELANGDVVLSCEGWGGESNFFDAVGLFDIAPRVEVILTVRPQVEWLNSAFWQWGAWSEVKRDKWLHSRIKRPDWYEVASRWDNLPWVSKVNVIPLSKDLVSNFFEVLGRDLAPDLGSSNASLNGKYLKFLQDSKLLRNAPHDSAIEFVIGRGVKESRGKAPWVLGPSIVEDVLSYHSPGNRKLFEAYPKFFEDEALRDRWFPRVERYRAPDEESALTYAELFEVAECMAIALKKIDAKYRKLKSRTLDL